MAQEAKLTSYKSAWGACRAARKRFVRSCSVGASTEERQELYSRLRLAERRVVEVTARDWRKRVERSREYLPRALDWGAVELRWVLT